MEVRAGDLPRRRLGRGRLVAPERRHGALDDGLPRHALVDGKLMTAWDSRVVVELAGALAEGCLARWLGVIVVDTEVEDVERGVVDVAVAVEANGLRGCGTKMFI